MNIYQAKTYIYQNARPLDYARWQYLFENGSQENVLKALRPAVVAMISTAGLSLLITALWGNDAITISGTSISAVILFVLSLVLLMKFKKSPILVMVSAGILNVIWHFISNAF